MTRSEKKKEEAQLNEAVHALCTTLRALAHRKARAYELEFLQRVRQIIDEEIETNRAVATFKAQKISERAIELLSPDNTDPS